MKTKLWDIGLRWCKLESPRLEVTLFHYFKGDALYFIYIQLYKLILSFHFDIDEHYKRHIGYYDQCG